MCKADDTSGCVTSADDASGVVTLGFVVALGVVVDVVVSEVHLSESLMKLTYRISEKNKQESL